MRAHRETHTLRYTGNPPASLSAGFITAVSRVQVERRNLRNEWLVRSPNQEEEVSKLEVREN